MYIVNSVGRNAPEGEEAWATYEAIAEAAMLEFKETVPAQQMPL